MAKLHSCYQIPQQEFYVILHLLWKITSSHGIKLNSFYKSFQMVKWPACTYVVKSKSYQSSACRIQLFKVVSKNLSVLVPIHHCTSSTYFTIYLCNYMYMHQRGTTLEIESFIIPLKDHTCNLQ